MRRVSEEHFDTTLKTVPLVRVKFGGKLQKLKAQYVRAAIHILKLRKEATESYKRSIAFTLERDCSLPLTTYECGPNHILERPEIVVLAACTGDTAHVDHDTRCAFSSGIKPSEKQFLT